LPQPGGFGSRFCGQEPGHGWYGGVRALSFFMVLSDGLVAKTEQSEPVTYRA
jgi:hypothetical protein